MHTIISCDVQIMTCFAKKKVHYQWFGVPSLCAYVRVCVRVCGGVVVAFSWLAQILGECSTIHSPPALFFFFFLKWRLARAR